MNGSGVLEPLEALAPLPGATRDLQTRRQALPWSARVLETLSSYLPVLMMGLLGGGMATQIRAGSPLFSHILFSVYLGLFMWGGLWLRNPMLRALFPIVKTAPSDTVRLRSAAS